MVAVCASCFLDLRNQETRQGYFHLRRPARSNLTVTERQRCGFAISPGALQVGGFAWRNNRKEKLDGHVVGKRSNLFGLWLLLPPSPSPAPYPCS